MKRFTLCFITVLIFCCMEVTCLAASMQYVGNKSTKVYHMSECTYAGKILSKNCRYFSSRSEAEAKGYRRCYYCGDGVVEPGHGGSGSDSNSDRPLSTGSSETDASKQARASKGNGNSNTETVIACLFYAVLGGFLLWEFFGPSKKTKSSQAQKSQAKAIATKEVPSLPISKPPFALKNEVPVKSSLIAAAAYDNATLYLRFTRGTVYAYQNVPRKLYEELLQAPSPGQYFHKHINNVYPYYLPK